MAAHRGCTRSAGAGGAYALDRVDRSEQWTWMYLVVARKPERPADARAA
jgi:hypothetical protein